MPDFSRINSFLESYIEDDAGYLQDIYDDARKRGIPVIRKNTRELLKLLILISRPEKILEVGTAVGYSALFMREAASAAGIKAKIVTLELDPDRAAEAGRNFEDHSESKSIAAADCEASDAADGKSCGEAGGIKLLQGDAYLVMKEMTVSEYGTFDMIFIDAAKAQYKNYMDEAVRLSRKGSIIVCDNIFLDGEILESHFLVEKRDRTVHDRMREFLRDIKNDERLETVLLSVGDGMSVSVVR